MNSWEVLAVFVSCACASIVIVSASIPCPESGRSIQHFLSFYPFLGIYLMNGGRCWPNGSYFRLKLNNPISCVHSEALDGTNDGGWILPSGDPCNNTTSPLWCTSDSPTNITLLYVKRSLFDPENELAYKCCLLNDCIIANVYGV